MTTSTEQESEWLERVEKLFLRFGVKSVTMDDVASDLGISKKTLYQHIPSKDELVMNVLQRHIARETNSCLANIAQADNAIEEIFLIMNANSQELAQIKTNVLHDLRKYHRKAWEMIRKFQSDFVFAVIKDNMNRGINEGLYRNDFDVDIVARLHLASSLLLFEEEFFPDDLYPRMILFKEFMMHNLHGILSPAGLDYLKSKHT